MYMHVSILSFANSITTVDVKLSLFKSDCLPSYLIIVHIYGYVIISILTPNSELYRRLLGFRTCDSASQMYVSHNINNCDAFMRKMYLVLCKECAMSIIL